MTCLWGGVFNIIGYVSPEVCEDMHSNVSASILRYLHISAMCALMGYMSPDVLENMY